MVRRVDVGRQLAAYALAGGLVLLAWAVLYVLELYFDLALVASLFVRFYQQRDRLRADTNVSAWLFTALTNLCHNHHRWKKRHPTVSIDPGTDADDGNRHVAPIIDLASELPGPDSTMAHDELLVAVRSAVDANSGIATR